LDIFTIGFTKKPARRFFELLQASSAKALVDVRLNNVSQLAGFTKRDDLEYFLLKICGMGYSHEISLAPTKALLDSYKKHGASWNEYELGFLELIRDRRIEATIGPKSLENSVLLCSEGSPHHCHRRLVAEYLREQWKNVDIHHLE